MKIAYLFCCVLVSPCASIYGIKQPRRLSEEDIHARDRRHNIAVGHSLDTNYVIRVIL